MVGLGQSLGSTVKTGHGHVLVALCGGLGARLVLGEHVLEAVNLAGLAVLGGSQALARDLQAAAKIPAVSNVRRVAPTSEAVNNGHTGQLAASVVLLPQVSAWSLTDPGILVYLVSAGQEGVEVLGPDLWALLEESR